jgi:hypothetical protein
MAAGGSASLASQDRYAEKQRRFHQGMPQRQATTPLMSGNQKAHPRARLRHTLYPGQ